MCAISNWRTRTQARARVAVSTGARCTDATSSPCQLPQNRERTCPALPETHAVCHSCMVPAFSTPTPFSCHKLGPSFSPDSWQHWRHGVFFSLRNGYMRLSALSNFFPCRRQYLVFYTTRRPYRHHCKSTKPLCVPSPAGCLGTASCFHSAASGEGSGRQRAELVSRLLSAVAVARGTALAAGRPPRVAWLRWGGRATEEPSPHVEIPSPSNR